MLDCYDVSSPLELIAPVQGNSRRSLVSLATRSGKAASGPVVGVAQGWAPDQVREGAEGRACLLFVVWAVPQLIKSPVSTVESSDCEC